MAGCWRRLREESAPRETHTARGGRTKGEPTNCYTALWCHSGLLRHGPGIVGMVSASFFSFFFLPRPFARPLLSLRPPFPTATPHPTFRRRPVSSFEDLLSPLAVPRVSLCVAPSVRRYPSARSLPSRGAFPIVAPVCQPDLVPALHACKRGFTPITAMYLRCWTQLEPFPFPAGLSAATIILSLSLYTYLSVSLPRFSPLFLGSSLLVSARPPLSSRRPTGAPRLFREFF